VTTSPQLYIPKHRPAPKPTSEIVSPAEYSENQRRRKAAAQHAEFAGRNKGKPHGTFVTDEAEQQLGVILCSGCTHKFDPKQYHYYKTREFRVQGRCDACKEHSSGVDFYIYEGLLGRKHGQCWWPK